MFLPDGRNISVIRKPPIEYYLIGFFGGVAFCRQSNPGIKAADDTKGQGFHMSQGHNPKVIVAWRVSITDCRRPVCICIPYKIRK